MAESRPPVFDAVIVEQELVFTLADLGQACAADEAELQVLVQEGVLEPIGVATPGLAPQTWRFGGVSLQRARRALRLGHDLELSPAGAALVLELLGEIDVLRTRLRRAGLA